MRQDFETQQKRRLEEFGRSLRDHRNKSGLSFRDVEHKSGLTISRSGVDQLERGNVEKINVFTLVVLAALYDVPLDTLCAPLDFKEYVHEVIEP